MAERWAAKAAIPFDCDGPGFAQIGRVHMSLGKSTAEVFPRCSQLAAFSSALSPGSGPGMKHWLLLARRGAHARFLAACHGKCRSAARRAWPEASFFGRTLKVH